MPALAEPQHSDTYADMAVTLDSRYPEFPQEHEGDKPHTFTRLLLIACQDEFESLLKSFPDQVDARLDG